MTKGPRARTDRSPAHGFTLIELAVTLFIVTLLLGSVLIPLQTQVETRKIEETQRILEQAREALLGYAASFGYFPCPAIATSAGTEPPPPAGPPPAPGTDHSDGRCLTYNGFLPAALLGFTPVDAEGFALDAWGGSAANRIRYAVSNHPVGASPLPFTAAGGMALAGIPALASNSDLIYVCGDGASVVADTNCGPPPAQRLASNVVAIVWSSGANAVSGGTSMHEAQNPNVNVPPSQDRIYVSRVRASSGADEFDDQLIWISGFTVVSRLLASGALP
jgi:prepilin-type N-terminal cleavage/methylation domain-containing protein